MRTSVASKLEEASKLLSTLKREVPAAVEGTQPAHRRAEKAEKKGNGKAELAVKYAEVDRTRHEIIEHVDSVLLNARAMSRCMKKLRRDVSKVARYEARVG